MGQGSSADHHAPGDHRHPARLWATVLLGVVCAILAVLLWRAREEMQQPQPVTVVPLKPAGSGLLQGGAPPDRGVVRPPRGHRVVILLIYPRDEVSEGFAAEVFPPTGEGPPRVVRVARRSDEALALDIGTGPVPGRYRIVLHAFQGEEWRDVATYGLRIGLPEPVEQPPAPPEGSGTRPSGGGASSRGKVSPATVSSYDPAPPGSCPAPSPSGKIGNRA